MTTTKTNLPTTIHTDGTVTLWDVYTQQWARIDARDVSDELLASLPADERAAIIEAARRNVLREEAV